MSKHFTGNKITASHTTAIDAAKNVIEAAQKLDQVTKISLSLIKVNLPHSEKRMKVQPVTGGIKLTIRGGSTVQEIFVYTNFPKEVEHLLYQAFNKR